MVFDAQGSVAIKVKGETVQELEEALTSRVMGLQAGVFYVQVLNDTEILYQGKLIKK